MTPAERRWNVPLPAQGCHFRGDENFVPQGSAISPGVEENDAVQHTAPGPGDPAPANPART